jgi:hypothetical protein
MHQGLCMCLQDSIADAVCRTHSQHCVTCSCNIQRVSPRFSSSRCHLRGSSSKMYVMGCTSTPLPPIYSSSTYQNRHHVSPISRTPRPWLCSTQRSATASDSAEQSIPGRAATARALCMRGQGTVGQSTLRLSQHGERHPLLQMSCDAFMCKKCVCAGQHSPPSGWP